MTKTASMEPKKAGPFDKKTGVDGRPAVEQLESELAKTREELRETIEELETANKELRVSNEQMAAMNDELNRLNTELKASEQNYRNIAESMPGMVLKYKLNPDGTDRLLYVSKGVAEVFEVSQEDAVKDNRLLWERIHEEDLERYVASIKESAENLSFWEQEHRIQLPEGRVKWIHTRGVPSRQADGSVIWDTLAVDVTERQRTMEKLQRSQSMLARTERIAHIGSWEWEIATDAVTWSDELYRIFKRDLRGKAPSWSEHDGLYHPADMQRLRRAVETAVSEGEPYQLELRALRTDGETRTCLVTGFPETDARGKVVRLVGSFQDITEQKQAETALSESEARFRAIFEQAAAGIATATAEGRFLEANRTFCDMLGYTSEELTEMTVYDLTSPEDIKRQVELDNTVLQGKRDLIQLEKRFLHKKGYTVWANLATQVLRDEAGFVQYVIGVVVDITERKRAEAALQEALTEKEALLREIHHRVKNNMQVIVGLLRMHARRTEDPDLTKAFDDCRDRIEAMSLVHEALYQSDDLARIDFEVYLKKLCRNLARAHNAKNKGIEVAVDRCNVTLNMDQGVAVGMLIAELISNAFKHAFSRGQVGNVSVTITPLDPETIELIVEDDGKGLPPGFDLHDPRTLGMRLVTGAVTRDLGGSIEVETGNGVRFIIRFKCEHQN